MTAPCGLAETTVQVPHGRGTSLEPFSPGRQCAAGNRIPAQGQHNEVTTSTVQKKKRENARTSFTPLGEPAKVQKQWTQVPCAFSELL